MKFKFLWVGKTKDEHWRALQEEYLRRLSHFVNCEIAEVKDASGPKSVDIEGNRITASLNQSSFVTLLDVKGRTLSSPELAAQIEKWQIQSLRDVTFVIGGAEGVSREVADRADFALS